MAEKIAEKGGKLTNATKTARTVQFSDCARGGRRRWFSVRGECSRGEGSEMRGGGERFRRGRSPQEAEAWGRVVGIVGAARAATVAELRERRREAVWRG